MNVNQAIVKILKAVLLYFLLLSSNFLLSAGEISERTEQTIKDFYRSDVSVEMIKYKIPKKIKSSVENECRQRFYKDLVYLYKIKMNDEVVGYGILDNVLGKSMPITFLVIYDVDGNIQTSSIIKYREPYGGGVSAKNWQDQFVGKNSESEMKYNADIDGISGATISVKSVTKGIKKLTLLLNKIKKDI